jgi:hypothetical protein
VHTEPVAHVDQALLDAPHVLHDVHRLDQLEDRVADQLAGTVPGDLAAAVDVDDRGAAAARAFLVEGAPAAGVDRRVFEQQEGVRAGAAGARLRDLLLEVPRRRVVDEPQLTDHDGV